MSYREYSWYAQRIVEYNSLKRDTVDLNLELRGSQKIILHLDKSLVATSGVIKNKDETINLLSVDNVKLGISATKSEAKLKRWKQFSLVVGSVSAILLGIVLIK